MFAPDLLHEIELGVWKGLFIHLLRILYAAGGDTIVALNSRYIQPLPNIIYLLKPYRYRQIPTFGRDTIRKFANNASGMKKLAARDFEDLLQVLELTLHAYFCPLTCLKCAIPVFEGLLPEVHDKIVMDLLFELATWHFLAKLRLHTESTVMALETSTTRLGAAFRKFTSITCEAYVTKALPSEEAARGRRQAALAQKKATSGKQPTNPSGTGGARGRRAADSKKRGTSDKEPTKPSKSERKYNLSAYKPHAIPDYAAYIRLNGTTDGFTSQVVSHLPSYSVKKCLAHQKVHLG